MNNYYIVALVDGRKVYWQSRVYSSIGSARKKLRAERRENPEKAGQYKLLKAHWYEMKEEK